MYFFLTGPLKIGKSTVVEKTLALLAAQAPLRLAGFMSYRAPETDPYVYLRPAAADRKEELYRLAQYDPGSKQITCFPEAFEQTARALLQSPVDVSLIVLDELGFLEQEAPAFQQAVYAALTRPIPVLGVLRQAEIPWHAPIKDHSQVTLLQVTLANRDALPQLLAAKLLPLITGKGGQP